MERKKIYKILTILFVMQWAFIQIIAQYPEFIEQYYSNRLYLYISKFLRFIFGWLPFSMGDILYILLIIIILRNIYSSIKTKKINFKNTFYKTGAFLSILFFLFNFNWALNYLRQPITKILNFKKTEYDSNELIAFTKKLILKSNEIHYSITKSDTILIENSLTKRQIRALSPLAYKQLELKYSQFKFENTSIKNSLFSVPLTYMGFAGYINPITNEAQVNSLIPKNSYPATVCHEIAHQVGIGPESEANFVGYLAAINSENAYYNYAGYLMATRYCLGEIYRTKPEQFDILVASLNKGIRKDLKNNQEFWKLYQNWSEKYFKFFYDSFLKANKQKDGIKGYNKMVSLLINYYKTAKL